MSLTRVQRAMLKVLSDGERHAYAELQACLYDEAGPVTNIWFHISNLRRIIEPKGQAILCEFYRRRRYYRQVKIIRKRTRQSV